MPRKPDDYANPGSKPDDYAGDDCSAQDCMTGLPLSDEFYFRLKFLTKNPATIYNNSLVPNRPVGSRFLVIFSEILILNTENLQ